MPPRKSEDELSLLSTSSAESADAKAPLKPPPVVGETDKSKALAVNEPFFSWAEMAAMMVVGAATTFLMHLSGALENEYHWMALLFIIESIRFASPTFHTMIQYAHPILMAAYYVHAGQGPSVSQMAAFMPTVLFLIGVPMSVCLHRYFAHAAFTTTRPMQCIVGVVATFAFQGGPLWWAGKHVRHHHFCDQPEDPHSVVQQGFWHAFCGWTASPINIAERDLKFVNPTLRVPELEFLDRYYLFPVAVGFTLLEKAGIERSFIACSVLLPMLFCRLITLLFNVEYHPAHDPKRCKSVDNPRLLALIVGESQHDLHHKSPAKSRRNDWDIPYWITLAWMEKVGLVWDLR